MAESPFRPLPSVDRILGDPRIRALGDPTQSPLIGGVVRQALHAARASIAAGSRAPSQEAIVENALSLAALAFEPSLRPVINATGVIIHTNLGRAPLSDEAINAMAAVSSGYSNLEFDVSSGERGSRDHHVSAALSALTGAEDGLAVNNNASALLLTLSALCTRREVVISRGQAVEIGGGFRIPDVMQQSGARLVEVGTTNRTYLRDYERAINAETAALMRVHASNFRIIGFTAQPPVEGISRIAHEHGLIMIDDIGSGCLLDTTRYGLAREPMAQESIAAGADLVLFSGDKLLGGPQAGLIVGRKRLLDELRRHPLARAVRLDKTSIAALAATLGHYLRGEAPQKVPVWRMIALPVARIERRARKWAREIGPPASVLKARSMIGGGSLPEGSLPTSAVAIGGAGRDVTRLAAALRTRARPVIGRIEGGALLLDPRTVDPRDDAELMAAVKSALSP